NLGYFMKGRKKLPAPLAERTAAVVSTVIAVKVTTRAVFFRACKTDVNCTSVKLLAVKVVDSFLVMSFISEFNEPEALRSAGVAVSNNTCTSNIANSFKECFEAVVGCSVSEATDK